MAPVDSLVPFQVLHEQLKAGNLEAWDEFYRRYEPLLRRIARRWLTPSLRRQADSVDVVQSIFRIALGELPGMFFESEGRLLGWLAVVTRHRVSHLGRREKGPGGAALSPLASDGDAVLGGAGPEEAAARAEELHRLKTALDRLPPDEREVVLLRDFEGLSFAETAERLSRPSADAARKLHDRARARLAEWVRSEPAR
jgi:RNA polymerase sigma-70 factor (ECF subfamily)